MKHEIDIKKYAPYFHDGILFSIIRSRDEISMKMCSVELNPEELEKGIVLSQQNAIAGILHFNGVKDIQISGNLPLENLLKKFDSGIILDFDLIENSIELGILWQNRPPKPRTNEFSTIIIQADLVWWENIPELAFDLALLDDC